MTNPMDTMKASSYKGPTNGALPVVHTDGNRLLDQLAADDLASRQAQAHALRLAEARAAKAGAPEPGQETAAESSTESAA